MRGRRWWWSSTTWRFIGRIARTVTVFHQGGILKEGSFAQIIADPRVRDVYLGRGRGA